MARDIDRDAQKDWNGPKFLKMDKDMTWTQAVKDEQTAGNQQRQLEMDTDSYQCSDS